MLQGIVAQLLAFIYQGPDLCLARRKIKATSLQAKLSVVGLRLNLGVSYLGSVIFLFGHTGGAETTKVAEGGKLNFSQCAIRRYHQMCSTGEREGKGTGGNDRQAPLTIER
jgi:hypothetical protein